MVNRRTVLKGSIAFGSLGLATTALGQEQTLVVHEFDGGNYPGSNDLGNWADAGHFTNGDGSGAVSDEALRLEYDAAGWFESNVSQSITEYQYLTFRVRGDDGGEESHCRLRIGGVDDILGNLTDDSIGTDWSTVAVDLEDTGADLENPRAVRLNFWEGESGAIEIDRIAVSSSSDGGPGSGGGTDDGTDDTDDDTTGESGDDWEPPFPDRPMEPDTLPSDITGSTTVADLYEHFDDPYYVPRNFLDYLPGESTSDAEKAAEFDYDSDAVENNVDDGSLTLDALGTQALSWVQQLAENDFPAHATVKLLPRLALLPDETEDLTLHNEPQSVWDETAGPTAASNSPDVFFQDRWPTDARTYEEMEVRVRDRVHDQPDYDDSREWGSSGNLPDSVLNNEDNPVLDAAAEKIHPVTGESMVDGFTSNAPMEAEVRMHVNSSGYWYQYLEFTNTSPVPYFLDGAVIWWLGPTGNAANLSDGHYNNLQRPDSSLGHPQRDVIEVIHPDYNGLSVYAIRIAYHDQPYHMRTAYPNQKWSLEIGTPQSASDRTWSTSEERQALVDTMLESLHVELETDLDRNDDIIDAIDLKYRVPN